MKKKIGKKEKTRKLLREKVEDDYPMAPLSQKALEEIWDDDSDKIWESYL